MARTITIRTAKAMRLPFVLGLAVILLVACGDGPASDGTDGSPPTAVGDVIDEPGIYGMTLGDPDSVALLKATPTIMKYYLALSPGGRYAAYIDHSPTEPAFVVVDLKNGLETRRQISLGTSIAGPAWSGSGQKVGIAVSAYDVEKTYQGDPDALTTVYEFDIANMAMKVVATVPRACLTGMSNCQRSLVLSPDGSMAALVTYVSREDPGTLTVLDMSSGNQRQLLVASGLMQLAWSSSSYDGDSIAYRAADSEGISLAYVARVNGGSSPTMVTLGAVPQWSPNGEELLVLQNERGNSVTYMVKVADKSTTFLLEGKGGSWSPDGGAIACVRKGDVYVINIQDRQVTRQTEAAVPSISSVVWSSDGEGLVFFLPYTVPFEARARAVSPNAYIIARDRPSKPSQSHL